MRLAVLAYPSLTVVFAVFAALAAFAAVFATPISLSSNILPPRIRAVAFARDVRVRRHDGTLLPFLLASYALEQGGAPGRVASAGSTCSSRLLSDPGQPAAAYPGHVEWTGSRRGPGPPAARLPARRPTRRGQSSATRRRSAGLRKDAVRCGVPTSTINRPWGPGQVVAADELLFSRRRRCLSRLSMTRS